MPFLRFQKIIFFFVCSLIISCFFLASCQKDTYETNPSVDLSFSTDTLTFDTIFTTLGSTTKQLLIYNPSSEKIKIESIKLSGGSSSRFRLNVDGDNAEVAKDIELAGKDSLFIFVTVTINPNDLRNPFLVQDSIEFSFNSKRQYYQLLAYGQNAVYHMVKNGDSVLYAGNHWSADYPHVVYGKCVVSENTTLTIDPGAKIYFNTNSSLVVQKGGKIDAKASYSNKIYLQSMRLDGYYKDLPGQWSGVYFEAGSLQNELEWLIIKNGKIGIYVDSTSEVSIKNTSIENMSNIGIYAKEAKIIGGNLLVANCQNNLLYLTQGGEYEFLQSTFANYWSYSSGHQAPCLYLNNYLDKNIFPLQLKFGNCIIYGKNTEEIKLDLEENSTLFYEFSGCLLKTSKLKNNNTTILSCLFNEDPDFVDYSVNNYHLGSKSSAINKGRPNNISEYQYDLDNVYRNASTPSIGCYEYKP